MNSSKKNDKKISDINNKIQKLYRVTQKFYRKTQSIILNNETRKLSNNNDFIFDHARKKLIKLQAFQQ